MYFFYSCLCQTINVFEETIILSRLDSLRRLLYDFTRCLAKLPYKRLSKKLGEEDEGRSAVSDEERNEVNSRGSINDEDFVADLISPGDVENYFSNMFIDRI